VGTQVSDIGERMGPSADMEAVVPEGVDAIQALLRWRGRRVNIGLLHTGSVRAGDRVLIHMGFVLERVDEERANQAHLGLELMGRGVDQQ
jgi:hydrogenase maturation factor